MIWSSPNSLSTSKCTVEQLQRQQHRSNTFTLSIPANRIRIDLLNQEYTVYYVGTNLGRIYKIVQFFRNNEPSSKLLDIFEVAPEEPIQVMQISQSRKSLYVATDNRVKQIDLAMCNRRYDSCFRCVKDPYCGWDKDTNVCRPYELGLLQVSISLSLYLFCGIYMLLPFHFGIFKLNFVCL